MCLTFHKTSPAMYPDPLAHTPRDDLAHWVSATTSESIGEINKTSVLMWAATLKDKDRDGAKVETKKLCGKEYEKECRGNC